MYKVILFLILLQANISFAQSLHPIEPVSKHYKELQDLDGSTNAKKSQMDSIKFFPESYNAVALLYTMMTPEYLTQEQVQSLKNAMEFPKNSSDQTRAELDFLLEWQLKRTKKEEIRTAKVLAPIGYWPHINAIDDHPNYKKNIEYLFFEGYTVVGETCAAENYPATAKLLKGITRDMRIMEFTIKYHMLRARPYILEPKLKPLQIMGSPSFASGHTLWGYIHAFTWSELLPAKRSEFLELAYEIGESREIMGIHYPSDDEAARVLAHNMLSSMWSNPEFISDFKKAQLEWKK